MTQIRDDQLLEMIHQRLQQNQRGQLPKQGEITNVQLLELALAVFGKRVARRGDAQRRNRWLQFCAVNQEPEVGLMSEQCVCCWQPATVKREEDWFCQRCISELEQLMHPAPPPAPDATIEIPGLTTIKVYK